MHSICKPFQSKFSCATFQNLQNTSRFVTLFSAHGDVVVGFAIFHIVYSKKKKKEKKERKRALLHDMWMLVGTRWNRLAMVWERKKGGEECQSFIKEHQYAKFQRTRNCSHLFIMEDGKSPLLVVDMKQPPLKIIFYLCFTNEKL